MKYLLVFFAVMSFLLMWTEREPAAKTNYTVAYIASLATMFAWDFLILLG